MNIRTITNGNTVRPLIRLTILSVVLLVLFASSVSLANVSAGYADIKSDVHEFLRKCVIKGYIGTENLQHKPLLQSRVAELLLEVSEQYSEIDDPILKEYLAYYLREYSLDVKNLSRQDSGFLRNVEEWVSKKRPIRRVAFDPYREAEKRHWRLSTISSDNYFMVLDPLIWAEYSIGDTVNLLRRGTGVQFHGAWLKHLGFSFRFVDNVERGAGPYSRRDQLLYPYAGYVGPLRASNETYFDLSSALINWNYKIFQFAFGKDVVSWGAVSSEHLLLGSNVPEYNHFRLTADLGKRIKLHYLLGSLHSFEAPPDTLYRSEYDRLRINPASKWIAAHRIEITPFNWLSLGFSEGIIWGERDIDLAYLNPLNFYYSAEHDRDDQDNVALSVDFILRTPYSLMFVGEMLIDDIKISSFSSDDPGNRIAYSIGMMGYGIPVNSVYFNVQYTRIRPYVYTHFYPVNIWSHWGNSLGSSLQPNSDELKLELSYTLKRNLRLNGVIASYRRGSLGSDLNEPITLDSAPFLGGVRNDNVVLGFDVQWELYPGLLTEIGYIDNSNNRIMSERTYFLIGYRYNLGLKH